MLRIKRLFGDCALPDYVDDGAAGMDLRASLAIPYTLPPGKRALISTGFAMEIPDGFVGMICPRSGHAYKAGITVLNAPGIVDSSYRGEVKILLVNLGAEPVEISNGDRIAQLMVCPVARMAPVEVDHLNETERGDGGWGHSGQN